MTMKEISDEIGNASNIHGIVEKQIDGLCMSKRIFMNGNKPFGSFVFSWDPGEILCEQLQLGWIDHYFGENKEPKLLSRMLEIETLEITIKGKVVGVISLEQLGPVTAELEKWKMLEKRYQVKGRFRVKEFFSFDQVAWIGTERVGYEKQKLMLLFVNRSLVRQNFSRFVNLLVGLNQKLLIALHGLEIKELSWFKELNEKGSLLEIVRCMAYVVEWLFVGQKMQTSKDFFPNCCFGGNQPLVSKLLRELFSEFLASRVWEPGGQDRKAGIILRVKGEDLDQSPTKVKMRSELKDDFGIFLYYYLEDKLELRAEYLEEVSMLGSGKVAKENGDEIEFFVQSVVKHNEVVAGSTQYMPTKTEKDQTVSKMATLTKKVRIADLIGVVEVCISLKAAFSRLVCLLKDMEVLERQEVETREFATLDWRQYKLIKEFDVVIMDKKKVAGAGSTRVKTTFPSFHFLPP
ncbi:hypothetical protein ISN45_At05g024530 [Arabidopsis thaliana x Arabidopsis arenosa]|uniref:Uncharacterized protein n=1 Tax=Arabidopsis thaliana x Arabidopsis arenosa TaxID=1240361 RepID=A0A8T2CVA4_9BRAS|nr:hypothetical protein ISN45_At05g024530 [Arabidopsis thaliana x Arabidopsis arenosa]